MFLLVRCSESGSERWARQFPVGTRLRCLTRCTTAQLPAEWRVVLARGVGMRTGDLYRLDQGPRVADHPDATRGERVPGRTGNASWPGDARTSCARPPRRPCCAGMVVSRVVGATATPR